MSVVKKKYKSGGEKKYLSGGQIGKYSGMVAGGVGGYFLGDPITGAKVGGMAGGAIGGAVEESNKEKSAKPKINYAASSYGAPMAFGGFIDPRMMLPSPTDPVKSDTTTKKKDIPSRTASEVQENNVKQDVALGERIRRMRDGDFSMVGDPVQADTVDVSRKDMKATGGKIDDKLPSEVSKIFKNLVEEQESNLKGAKSAEGQISVMSDALKQKYDNGEIEEDVYRKLDNELSSMYSLQQKRESSARDSLGTLNKRSAKGAKQKSKVKSIAEGLKNENLNNLPGFAFGGQTDSGGRKFKKKKKNLDAESRDESNSYSDMMLSPAQKEFMKHKGGQEKSIGQDATKFEGKSHEQGGIDVDSETEVEGGETKDNVGGGEYIFSKRVKVPGTYKTFAEVHEEMVKNNANPEQIEKLAQMQEKVTGRA